MEFVKRILVVEDEPKIREGLVDFLQFHDFEVCTASDGLEAERIVESERFDLILLDLMLPKISGEQLCVKWRQGGVNTPIIMLTAKGLEYERIAGLNLGADDYVTKPFSLEELLARIRAILRRTDPAMTVGQVFDFGSVTVDVAGLKINVSGKGIKISGREAEIIRFFAANPSRVIGRQELYEKIWGESMDGIETRTVDVHIAKLRSKFDGCGDSVIQTVRGSGYIYEPVGQGRGD
jgi:DNA-binding response OmpR family regulator